MANILLISDEVQGLCLKSDLEYIGHVVHQILLEDKSGGPELLIGNLELDLVVIDPGGYPDILPSLVQGLKKIAGYDDLPVLAVVEEMAAIHLDFSIGIQDFIVKPCSLRQMEARFRLALWNTDRTKNKQILKIGGLVINLERYEVRVNGSVIELALSETMGRILARVTPDQVGFSEDMAYKAHSIISPAMVEEFLETAYKRWIPEIKASGCEVLLWTQTGLLGS